MKTLLDEQGINKEITLEVVFPPIFTIQRHLEAYIKCQVSYKNSQEIILNSNIHEAKQYAYTD